MTREEFSQRTGIRPCDEECNGGDYKVLSDSDIIILLEAEESKKELIRQTAYLLIRKADEWSDEETYSQAVLLIGRSECIRYKFDNDLELSKEDKEYLINKL